MTNKNFSKMFSFLLAIAVFGLVGCGVGDDFEANDFPGNAFVKGGAVVTPINIGGLFIEQEPSSEINFDVKTKGDEVSMYTIYKQLNGGARVQHAQISDFSQTIVVSLAEAADGLAGSPTDLTAGDIITLTYETTSAGGTFISTDRINSVVACPPEVQAVAYTSVASGQSTDGCCPGTFTVESEVMVTFSSGIDFVVSDWSAGLYFDWYDVYGITAENSTDGSLSGPFQELCLDLNGSFGEPFGATASLSGTYDPQSGVIEYDFTNDYGDTGKVTLTPK